jgi:hypothetical protein
VSLLSLKQYDLVTRRINTAFSYLTLALHAEDSERYSYFIRKAALTTLGVLHYVSRWGYRQEAYVSITSQAKHLLQLCRDNNYSPGMAIRIQSTLSSLQKEIRPLKPTDARRRSFHKITIIAIGLGLMVMAIKTIPFIYRETMHHGIKVTVYEDEAMSRRIGRASKPSVFATEKEYLPYYFFAEKDFTAKWRGYLHVPQSGLYEFFTEHTFGLEVWLDNEKLISNLNNTYWSGSGRHASRQLAPGFHELLIIHHVQDGRGHLRMRWSGPGIPANTLVSAPELVKDPGKK